MSEDNKDKNEFEFIKAEVIPRKHKRARKWLLPIFMTVFMAILFGMVAAVTFCLAEPGIFKFLHKEEVVREPIIFPTTYPEDNEDNEGNEGNEGLVNNSGSTGIPEPTVTPTVVPLSEDDGDSETVIVNTIDADLDDYIKIHEDIKEIRFRVNKSLVTVSSIKSEDDWFGDMVETRVDTPGIIIAKNTTHLYILVSLDRVMDAGSIKLMLTESTMVDAVLQDYESEINLAILAVKQEDIPTLHLNNLTTAELGESYTITVGDPVIILGSPNGYINSMDVGFITSEGSYVNITDCKIDLFNTNIRDNDESDGIVINFKGQVIGVITRTLKEELNEEINTVIGISKLNPFIDRMINLKPHIYCGVIAADLTEAAKAEHEVVSGIYVNSVKANSPAFEAGIKGGDIIQMIDAKSIINTNAFFNTISGYEPGSEITIRIKRTSGTTVREMDLQVVLGEKDKY